MARKLARLPAGVLHMPTYTPRNVLITGGAGFIGCHFVRYLLSTDPRVRIVNLDVLTYAGSLDNLKELPDPDRHTVVPGDIATTRWSSICCVSMRSIPSCISPRSPTWIGPLRVPRHSSRQTSLAPSRCSMPPVSSGCTTRRGMRVPVVFTMSPRMRSTALSDHTIRHFAKPRRMLPTPHTQPVKRRLTI